MDKLLEVKDVSVRYEKNIVLNNINLSIYENDFLGIIGPNGGGKSTLLKVMLNLLSPMSGEIWYHPKLSQKKGSIGYLPQLKEFDKKFPIIVQDVVLSGLMGKVGLFKRFSKQDRKKADQILENLGIEKLRRKAIGELSGGQMQKVFLCRALIFLLQIYCF